MTKVFAVAVSLLTLSLGTVALSFKTIDVEGSPLSVNGTAIQGMNDRGDVVGFTYDADFNGHAYLVHDGVVTFFKAPIKWGAGDSAVPRSINASGDIVGEYADGAVHGFLRDHHGEWTSLDVPGSKGGTIAFGINGHGEIVGTYTDDDWYTDHAFLFRPGHDGAHGSYVPFDYPGASVTEAYGVNDDGDVVGVYAFESDWIPHGFLQHEGDFIAVDVPGAQGTMARGINSRGEIVGQFWDADWFEHGFLLSKGTYTTFDVPGALQTRPRSINDHGEIAGNYDDENWVTHGFKAVRAHH
jgi:probable HAF family extracellular repeat protein